METPFTKNFEVLVALISHLGVTNRSSRTPTFIANDLGFDKQIVANTLDNFPVFFRKSTKGSRNERAAGDKFFTLQLRYSKRKQDKLESGSSQPLSKEEIAMLIDLVSKGVEQEQENLRSTTELNHNYKTSKTSNRIALYVALFAAAITIITALI